MIYLFVYFNDIIITGDNPIIVQHIIDLLAQCFSIKDLGNLSCFLGVEVLSTPIRLFFSQKKYVTYLLARTNMIEANVVSTPLAHDTTLSIHFVMSLMNPT